MQSLQCPAWSESSANAPRPHHHRSRRLAVCGGMWTGTRCRCVFVCVAVCVFERWSCIYNVGIKMPFLWSARRARVPSLFFSHVCVRAHVRTHAHTRNTQGYTHHTGAVPAALGGAGMEPSSVAAEFEACQLEVCLCDAVTCSGMYAHSKRRRKHMLACALMMMFITTTARD